MHDYSTILIKNARILGKNENTPQSLLIKNDKIEDIGSNISQHNIDKIIDAKNKILMPGLINTHTHIPMTLFRGLADDINLDKWLNEHIWPIESYLNGEYCYIGALLGIVELIKSGTTTFNDMYFYMEDVANAVDDSGIRACLSYGMIDFADSQKRENQIQKNLELFKTSNNTANDRIKVFLGPHAPYTASKELLIKTRQLADKLNTKIHIHISETKKEVKDIINQTGQRPFEYLDNIGFLGPDVIAAHATWLNNEEIKIIKKHNVKISHNPCSNMKLASGISPVHKMINEDICVSIGTDGASSNNNLDLIEEMKTASLLQKVNTLNPKALNAYKTIEMATINGAHALGLENEIGSIEIGKKADIILIDTENANIVPDSTQLESNIVYAANGSNIDTTICNGKILMENKKLLTLDELYIYKQAREAIEELKNLKK